MKPKILVTAGPTREYIDPVRYLTNASSGIMGYSLAEAASNKKWKVVLVSGPVDLSVPKGVRVVNVVSARDMFSAVKRNVSNADIVIGCAAVADYRSVKTEKKKLKRSKASMTMSLIENPDIIGYVGKNKRNKVVVGFALETHNSFANAEKKCKEKNLDLIVVNSPKSVGNVKTTVTMLTPDGKKMFIKNQSKKYIAKRIINEALRIWKNSKACKISC